LGKGEGKKFLGRSFKILTSKGIALEGMKIGGLHIVYITIASFALSSVSSSSC